MTADEAWPVKVWASGPVRRRQYLAAVPELFQPLLYLLVVVQETAIQAWQVNSMQKLESPTGHLIRSQLVGRTSMPLSGPPVRLVPSSRAGQDSTEPLVDLSSRGRKLLANHFHRLPHAPGRRTDLPR
ncbi:hypothetical protein [Actinoplanes sp. N902-109]|uniref:hypothetical protein n=1 Tax=Actinoplanes sp. (strain N902-109) TaxID=649831 RepID=UPI0012FA207B|nr:hypothetical protein [Actinoplanes sp. N902-109]